MKVDILRSLDPHHQRIGYLGVLASVAARGLDRVDALKARLEDVLYERIYPDDPRYDTLMTRIRPSRRAILEKLRQVKEDPAAILRGPEQKAEWNYLSALWLCDDCMPSPLGFLGKQKTKRLIDLGRWTGVLLPTLELSELGFIICLLIRDRETEHSPPGLLNWLNAGLRPALRLVYLHAMLAAEALWPYVLKELVRRWDESLPLATRGENGLLRHAVTQMVETVGDSDDLDDVLPMKELLAFQQAIEAKPSTAENYLRPRLEMLVDLGLIERTPDTKSRRSKFVWKVTDRTRKLATEWAPLAVPDPAIQDYLETRFFAGMNRVFDSKARQRTTTDEEKLLWFARAFSHAGREFGYTPGSTLASLACYLAFEKGILFEMREIMTAVPTAARSQWGQFLHFSGGSRFDQEFLIRVDSCLEHELTRVLGDERT